MKNHRSRAGLGLALTVTLLALVSSGCGNLTMGGFGNAKVVVSGDVPSPAPSLAVVGAPTAAPPVLSSHDDDDPEGEIEVDFMLFLVSETGSLTQLGEGDIEARVDLRGRAEVDAVEEMVPVARYTELQVVFTKIQAEVDSGLIINGQPVVGEVRVEFEDLTLLVPKPIDVDVTAGSFVEFVLDLNTAEWLQAVDPNTGLVDASVFAALMNVTTR